MYELLGNDPELDPNRPADPPTRAIEKPVMRHGKREGSDLPKPIPERQSHQNRAKQTDNANENAFRDRGVGSDKNRGRGSGEPTGAGARGGQRGRGRGGRGGRGGARGEGDRHSRTGISEHDKQAAHGWGGKDGDAELADEQAGEAIAQAEEKDAIREDAEAEAEAEPEDKSKSYAAYLAELAEKKLSLAAQNVRKPNEGSSQKFPEGTALSRDEQEDFIAGGQGKAKRERARKEKVHVELDGDRMLAPPPREGGGRGRGRGRGEFRGGEGRGRGNGEGRGRGEGRGEFRGGRGRGGEARGRGDARGRGGRGGAQSGPNITDSSAFPSLGA
jgi:plasminogen activator inhibitor 1 RNA-binding protein